MDQDEGALGSDLAALNVIMNRATTRGTTLRRIAMNEPLGGALLGIVGFDFGVALRLSFREFSNMEPAEGVELTLPFPSACNLLHARLERSKLIWTTIWGELVHTPSEPFSPLDASLVCLPPSLREGWKLETCVRLPETLGLRNAIKAKEDPGHAEVAQITVGTGSLASWYVLRKRFAAQNHLPSAGGHFEMWLTTSHKKALERISTTNQDGNLFIYRGPANQLSALLQIGSWFFWSEHRCGTNWRNLMQKLPQIHEGGDGHPSEIVADVLLNRNELKKHLTAKALGASSMVELEFRSENRGGEVQMRGVGGIPHVTQVLRRGYDGPDLSLRAGKSALRELAEHHEAGDTKAVRLVVGRRGDANYLYANGAMIVAFQPTQEN